MSGSRVNLWLAAAGHFSWGSSLPPVCRGCRQRVPAAVRPPEGRGQAWGLCRGLGCAAEPFDVLALLQHGERSCGFLSLCADVPLCAGLASLTLLPSSRSKTCPSRPSWQLPKSSKCKEKPFQTSKKTHRPPPCRRRARKKRYAFPSLSLQGCVLRCRPEPAAALQACCINVCPAKRPGFVLRPVVFFPSSTFSL